MASPRLSRPFILALVVLILLWAAALGVLARGRSGTQFPVGETVDDRFSARPGVNLSRDDLAPNTLDTTLGQLAEQGIAFVRLTLPWDEIESGRGHFEWATWDAALDAFASHPSLQPVVVLDRSPAAAASQDDADNPLAPPHERSDFGAFARAVAERYRDKITYYQVWDEPNIAPHWGVKGADPADYAGLLREAAANIRAADSDARIVAAALSPNTEGGGPNLSDVAYLDQLYAAGGRDWFDLPAVEPYGFSSAPDAAPDPARLDFGRASLLRSVMLRHGDTVTPLWATAFGWDAAAATSPFGNVSSEDQTAYARASFETARRDWPWLGPLMWTSRFPMLPATRNVLQQAAAPPQLLGPGAHAADSPALHYTGWRVTPSAADPTADGDTLDFTFSGTGVALDVQGGPYWAYLTAIIDGEPANRLPRNESGATYLVLHDPAAASKVVPVADGLPAGQHTVRLTAHGGWGQWPLRKVIVTSAASSGNREGLALLGLALLASVVVGAVAFRHTARLPSSATISPIAEPAVATAPSHAAGSRSRRVANLAVWILAAGLCALFLLSSRGMVNLAVVALLGLLFLARPELAPPLIAASLPWWQRTQPVFRWQFGLFEVLAWLALLAWIARAGFAWLSRKDGSQPFGRPTWLPRGSLPLAIDISVLALVGSGLLAAIFASEQGVAWREFRIVFLFALVFYLLITRGDRQGTGKVGPLVAGLLAGATIASVAGLWQFFTGQGRVDVEGVGRIAGFYGSPNNLALILDRAVPLAVALASFAPLRKRTQTDAAPESWAVSRPVRGLLIAVSLITLAAAIATFSKGAILLGLPVGLAVVLIGGAWRRRRRWPLVLLAAIVVLGGLGLDVLFRTPRFADLLNFEGGTSFFRLKLWRGALNMALDHPLIGVGPDNFLYAYRTRYVLPSGWQELNLSHPHNILLDLWTRLGLVGVVAGMFALVTSFVAGWLLFRPQHDAPDLAMGQVWSLFLGLLGGLVATVTHGLIDNSLFLPDLAAWFVAAMAIFWLYHVEVGKRASAQSKAGVGT